MFWISCVEKRDSNKLWEKRDIFVKKNAVLLKKYGKKNYTNKIYGYE